MRRNKMMFCTFCNKDVVEEGHISRCPNCQGDLHNQGDNKVCACCGKVFPTGVQAVIEPEPTPEFNPEP